MFLTLKNLKDKISKDSLKNLYFIIGPEQFLIREILQVLQTYFLKTGSEDFNYHVFRAGEMESARLRETILTLPVMSEKRMVLCEDAHRLSESDWESLKPVITEPVTTSVLVFVSKEADKRKKIIKNLMACCEVVSAQTPKESEWTGWVNWMGRKSGIRFSPEAGAMLQQYAGYDLLGLENEIKKLSRLFDKGSLISEEDVFKVVPRIRPENVFALSKAIAQKKLSEAFLCLARLLEDNQNEIGALALITRHIRILARIKEGLKKGYTEQTLCHKTGLPRFFIKDYIKEAESWSEQKIISTMETLCSTDRAIKSSPLSSHIWLENLILKTCSL